MAEISVQVGDSWNKKPGTSNQTGNAAPKFSWKTDPAGRVALITILSIAFFLKYNNSTMGRRRVFPMQEELYNLFIRLLPWFPQYYNEKRRRLAVDKRYPVELLEPFEPQDARNRLLYMFTLPGNKGSNPEARLYGISNEHPEHTHQGKPGKLREVWVRCSAIVEHRLRQGGSLSVDEVLVWGRRSELKMSNSKKREPMTQEDVFKNTRNDPVVQLDWIHKCFSEATTALSDWEIKFLRSIRDQIHRKQTLSDRQVEILERIYAEKTS